VYLDASHQFRAKTITYIIKARYKKENSKATHTAIRESKTARQFCFQQVAYSINPSYKVMFI